MTAIAVLLARWGLGERAAKALAPVAAVVAVLALLAAVWGASQLWDRHDDRQAVRQAEDKREAKAGAARENAASERVADAIANARSEEELHDAIDNAPKGGELSPAARALACERLRRRGNAPAACGPAGGDGIEARPH